MSSGLIGGRHRIVRGLGSGGMGDVSLAADTWRSGRTVAIKTAPLGDAARLRGLEREFARLAALRHPNVVRVHDFGTCPATGLAFYTMEHAEGRTLAAAAAGQPWEAAAGLLVQVCRALDFVHSRGLAHGDVKAENVIVQGAGSLTRALLVDFGLCAPFGQPVREGGSFSGTLTHAAPELLAAGGGDARSDLYALGVTAWTALAGRPPFAERDPLDLVRAHREQAPPVLAEHAASVPAAASDLVARLLAKRPEDRPGSALEVAEALAATAPDVPAQSVESLIAHVRAPRTEGQEQARAALHALVERLADPRAAGARALLLVGGAGLGKTRLLGEARVQAQLGRLRVLTGHAASDEPYGPLVEPVRAAVHHLGADTAAVRDLLPELVKVDPSLRASTGVEPSAALPLADERLRLGAAVARALDLVATRPTLILLDDLPPAASEAAWLVGYLVRQGARARERSGRGGAGLVLAMRPRGDDDETGSAFRRDGEVVRLFPLDLEATRRLACGALDRLDDADAVVDRLHEGVGGDAGLLERWLTAAVRAGGLVRDAGGWRAHLGARVLARPPEDLAAGLRDDVRALPSDQRAALLAAALLPAGTDTRILAAVLRREPADVALALDELERRDLLAAPVRPDGRSVSVRSALVRRAAREAAATGLAAAAGELLDAAVREDVLEDAARAELAELAGRRAEAAAAWGRALAAARGRGDWPRAERLAARLAGAATGAVRRQALRARVESLAGLERFDAADGALAELRAEPGERDAAEAAAEEGVAAALHRQQGQWGRALDAATSRLALLPAASSERWPARLDVARSLSGLGDERAEAELEALVDDAPGAAERGQALLALGGWLLRRQRPARAAEVLREARPLLAGEAAEDGAVANLGVALLQGGDLAGASSAFAEALDMRRRRGARAGTASLESNLAVLAIERERGLAATRHAAAALALQQELGHVAGQLLATANLAVARLVRQDAAGVRRALSDAAVLLEEAGDERVRQALLHADLLASELVGDLSRAEACRSDLAASLVRMPRPRTEVSARVAGAALDARAGRADRAEEELRALLASAGAMAEADRAEIRVELAALTTRAERLWRSPLDPVAPVDRSRGAEALRLLRAALPAVRGRGASRARVHLELAALWGRLGATRGSSRHLGGLRRHLVAAARLVRRRRAPWLIAAEVDAARAWRQAARGRLAAAEALYARSLARVRTGLERVPADERGTFLADARRANLREALLAVRRARLAAAAAGAFFDPLDQPAVPGRAGAAAAQGLAGARAEVARLREVIEIGRHLNTLMPVRELLDRVLESAMKFLRAERGFLVLGSPEEFRFAASRDAGGHEVPEAGFAVSRSVLAEVLRTARPLLSSDARADARFTSKESVLALDLHSVLVAPLVARDEVLGALYVDNSHATGVFDEADRDLLVLFAAQAAVAVANARLHETRLEKERLDQELAIARAIQQGLLPRDLPGPSGFRVAALMEPARDIGGDYYDFLPGPHGGHRVAIGDVSGKGVPAALFMVMARTVLRSVAGAGGLKEALVAANAILESQIEDDKFMTMLLLEPDPDGRCVRYCLAGHEPPITWRAASGRAELLGPGGLALGILPDVLPRLEESVVETAPGDLVVCYTDGVLDCASPDGERFGRERLLRFVARHGGRGAAGLLEALRAELEAFRSAGERADDVTLLILEAGPAPGGRGA